VLRDASSRSILPSWAKCLGTRSSAAQARVDNATVDDVAMCHVSEITITARLTASAKDWSGPPPFNDLTLESALLSGGRLAERKHGPKGLHHRPLPGAAVEHRGRATR
jgi:hypothetical protein